MKNLFNKPLIQVTADVLAARCQSRGIAFDIKGFVDDAANDLDALELKARSLQITQALTRHLPASFEVAVDVIDSALLPIEANTDLKEITTTENGLAGWILMPVSDFIGIKAIKSIKGIKEKHNIPLAMESLKQITQRFTSEFGIRHLLLSHPQVCLKIMSEWVGHECHHVRRLVSEGSRPLLPWAMQLPDFKQNPEWVLPLLEALKDDSSEYVRRSVANHINDISKSHPQLVIQLSGAWLTDLPNSKVQATNRQRMVKHACRTLIKAGNSDVLGLFGFNANPPVDVSLALSTDTVTLGESVEMTCVLQNRTEQTHSIILDYQVRHRKANGRQTAKVFKWKTLNLGPKERVSLTKKHPFKLISTRVYYEGEQGIDLQINGDVKASGTIELKLKKTTE